MRQDLRLASGSDLQDWHITELRTSSDAYLSWKAQNLLTDQLAELRIYNPDTVPSAMVIREVNYLTQVCHPGFPRLLGHFPYRGAQVVITSHIEGCTLAELMEMNPNGLPLEMAENAGRALLAAIHHLHQLPGTPVHRALHPGNVLVDECMNVFLSGLAFAEASSVLAGSETLYYNTGDARYEAPEVFGNPAATSVASNVYSSAAILFEMFTGKRAFDSYETVPDRWFEDVAYQHKSIPAPMVSDYAAWIPERIAEGINQALSKEPDERPASCIATAYLMSGQPAPVAEIPEPDDPPPHTASAGAGRKGFWGWLGREK